MSTEPIGLAELDDVAIVFDALSHPARRHILLVLLARGASMTSGEVATRFSTTWATVSRHLKTLETAGLVARVDGTDGRTRSYDLNRPRLVSVAGGWIERFDQATSSNTTQEKA